MDRRIQNIDDLASHGNVCGRKAILEMLEVGLEASDPYYNTKKLIRLPTVLPQSARQFWEWRQTPLLI